MSTNSKPLDPPKIVHFPLKNASKSTPDSPIHNPTHSFNPLTQKSSPCDYTRPFLQFQPKNNAIVFHVSEFGVVTVQLNRPKALNAVNLALVEDLYDVLQFLLINQYYFRCVVLMSSGEEDFSAGLDIISVMGGGDAMKKMMGQGPSSTSLSQQQQSSSQQQQQSSSQQQQQSSSQQQQQSPSSPSQQSSSNSKPPRNGMKELLTQYHPGNRFYSDYSFDLLPDPLKTSPSELKYTNHNIIQHICVGWQQLSVPVICCVNGLAIGAGFQMIMGADVRLLTKKTKISILEAKWGLVPDMGITGLCRGIIPEDKLKLLTYTANFVQGEDLVKFNVSTVPYLFENNQAMYDYLNQLITNILFKSPHTVINIKNVFNYTSPYHKITPYKWEYTRENGRKVHFEPHLLSNFNIEQLVQTPLLNDPNHKNVIAANITRKYPIFIIEVIREEGDNDKRSMIEARL